MAKGKRKVPDINSSSTADIAFLLLIFFLITTSMDTDRGLARLLPPPPEDEKNENTDKIKERNILQVYIRNFSFSFCHFNNLFNRVSSIDYDNFFFIPLAMIATTVTNNNM